MGSSAIEMDCLYFVENSNKLKKHVVSFGDNSICAF